MLAEETAGQTRWALGDHQGSVRDVINNTGTVLNHTTYDSFGQVTSETSPGLDFRFGYTGRELDEESELMQYRARYYDPAVGTFVGEDPLGFGAGDANLYRYVFNSPTNFTDPSGEFATVGVVLGVGAVAAVGAAAAIHAHNQLQTPEARGVIGDSFEGLGSRFSDLAQTQQQLAQDAGRNIRDSARQYQGLASGVANAFPTTISLPGAFGPNDADGRPQAAPGIIPVAKNFPVGVGDPNSINKPSDSRDLVWPGGICKVPRLDGDSRPNFEQPYLGMGNPKSPQNFEEPTNPPQVPDIPSDYVTESTKKDNGIIYRPSGTAGKPNTIRVMGPTSDYPDGYWVKHNKTGQPIDPSTGRTGTRNQTHVPLPPGYWQ